MNAPTRQDFQRELRALLFAASRDQRRQHITVDAGELHRRVGGYPDNTGKTNRMPICCSVIDAEMLDGDEIIDHPPSGQGATLTISYRLPRTHRLATFHIAQSQADK